MCRWVRGFARGQESDLRRRDPLSASPSSRIGETNNRPGSSEISTSSEPRRSIISLGISRPFSVILTFTIDLSFRRLLYVIVPQRSIDSNPQAGGAPLRRPSRTVRLLSCGPPGSVPARTSLGVLEGSQ